MNNTKQETENQIEKNEGKVKEPQKFLQKTFKNFNLQSQENLIDHKR